MPIIISQKQRAPGTASPKTLGEEIIVVSVQPQADEYLVEGYIDLGNMQTGDKIIITEYIAVDGTNLRKFNSVEFNGKQEHPIIRTHTKTLDRTFAYKVTLTQTEGVLRSYPYAFIIEILGAV